MSRPAMSRPDRRRRRAHRSTVAWLVAAVVVLAVLIGGALRIGRASGPYWGAIDRSYAAQGRALVDQSNRANAQLGYVLGSMARQSRTTVQSELDLLVRTTASTAQAAAALAPPAPWGGLGTGFAGALADRARAVAQLRRTVDGLLDMAVPADTTTSATDVVATTGRTLSSGAAASDLGGVGTLLERADRSYAAVRRGFRRAPGAPWLPASRWVTDPANWAAGPVAGVVGDLLGSPTLAPIHQVVLVPNSVSVEPPAVPQGPTVPGATSVLMPTRSVTATVVVANRGNVVERGLTVTAAVRPLGGGRTAQRVARLSLAPGRSVAVVLPPLPVVPGHAYDLTLSVAPPAGQAAGSATTVTFPVEVAPATSPPPTTTTTTTTTTTAPKAAHPTASTTAPPKKGHGTTTSST